MKADITPAQARFLMFALRTEQRFDSGVYPTGGAQGEMVRRLVRRKLLRFDGWGRDIDGRRDADVPIYRMTAKAREVMRIISAQCLTTRKRP